MALRSSLGCDRCSTLIQVAGTGGRNIGSDGSDGDTITLYFPGAGRFGVRYPPGLARQGRRAFGPMVRDDQLRRILALGRQGRAAPSPTVLEVAVRTLDGHVAFF